VGRGARALAFVGLAAACAIACNAVLGITDVPSSVDAGGVGPNDASATALDANEGSTSTHVPEAGAQATADAAADATVDASADAPQVSYDAPATDVAPVCDTMNDVHNCGHCGRDCLGGQCSMGVCQAVQIFASDAGVNPYDLAQDDAFLYWPDWEHGTVYRTSKTSSETTLEYQNAQGFGTNGIAVDDAALYWGDWYAGILRCSKTSCSNPTPAAHPGSAAAPFRLAIDTQGVYWTEGATNVFAAHKYGTGETPSVLWHSDAGVSANAVATDGQRVYFTASDGLLHGVGVDGGGLLAISTLAGDAASGSGIALNDGVVYWTVTDNAQGIVALAPTSSLGVSVIATTPQGLGDIASDGTTAYWVSGTGQIMSCDIAVCSPAAIAQGATPGTLLVDKVAVYWADSTSPYYGGGGGNGSIWKIAK